MKALLVDDDPLQLHMSTELLRQKGIVCTSCNDPTKVLEYLEKERFDIILSDIQMPGMDGFELIEQIRRFPDRTFKNPGNSPFRQRRYERKPL